VGAGPSSSKASILAARGCVQQRHAGQQSWLVANLQKPQTQRDCRERMPRIWPPDGATRIAQPATAKHPTLAAMADQLPKQSAGATPAQIVEEFLHALRYEECDAMAAALDDDAVSHNVGLRMIRGSYRRVRFLRRPNGWTSHLAPSR
jgi:hypothetical protein